MFGRRKKKITPYNPKEQKPVIRCSICTGERVAGFRTIATGRFEEVAVLHTTADYEAFLRQYSVPEEEITTEY